MIYDVFTYNHESDILDIRFNVLYPYVDKFVIIEFDETFSGKKKSQHLLKDWRLEWIKFLDKIDYVYIDKQQWSQYEDLADSSPNVPKDGPTHWKREFCQKESIKDALTELKDDDIVFIGDVDEIWNPELFKSFTLYPCKLKLKVYSYFLDNKSDEIFWGTIVAQYKDIKGKVLNHLRTNDLIKTEYELGWHFTSQGGYNNVKKKLTDSYTKDSYANDWVLNNLERNINDKMDFLGREFHFIRDDSEWPNFIKDNKFKYRHLLIS